MEQLNLFNQEDYFCTKLPGKFNLSANLPYDLTLQTVSQSMESFVDFLSTMSEFRLEEFLMPAIFSGIVSDFMISAISKRASHLIKNSYHNGHPDLIPVGHYPPEGVLHGHSGIEIKASKNNSWQAHNREDNWFMIFCFNPNPFEFTKVVTGLLTKDDWNFYGRGENSRRTNTAQINKLGKKKLNNNWIYKK